MCACARERLPASPPGQLLPVGKERAGLREAGYEPELALAWELSRRTRIPAREFRGREEGAGGGGGKGRGGKERGRGGES